MNAAAEHPPTPEATTPKRPTFKPKAPTRPEQRGREAEKQSSRGDRDTDETHETDDSALSASVQTLQDAARITLEHGMENSHFILARAVKAFEVRNGRKLPKAELPGAFSAWWSMANGRLPPDADYDEYLFVFLDAYERVKHPLGCNVLEVAKDRARKQPLPKVAQSFKSPKLQWLVSVCYQLQHLAGESPFFLSIRTAAKLIDVRIETASAFLSGLVQQGVLVLEQRGTPGGHKASRYRMPIRAQAPSKSLDTPTL